MEKIVNLWNYSMDDINKELKDGWAVKMIVPYSQHVSCGGHAFNTEGAYGAFVVLEKSNGCDTINSTFIEKMIALLQTPFEIPCGNHKYTYDDVINIILEYRTKIFNKLGDIINDTENN